MNEATPAPTPEKPEPRYLTWVRFGLQVGLIIVGIVAALAAGQTPPPVQLPAIPASPAPSVLVLTVGTPPAVQTQSAAK